ncbi:helix-turn-helix transcriptional regulator [Olivibacter sp. CPCC 100613]|uniref:helix-turn-helix domain-containing protein n=1 Tax=Olivibacter sp. CPCC 100613 TaxID=3079931 RepID=UPI002FF5A121
MAKSTESLTDFYRHKFNDRPENPVPKTGPFNVFRIEDSIKSDHVPALYTRRDFYKIMLLQGHSVFHYGDKSIPVNGNTLLFFNPQLPYTSEPFTPENKGYFCVFKDEFFKTSLRINLNDLPLFSANTQPIFALDEIQFQQIKAIFEKICSEIASNYVFRYELIKGYVNELIYLAIKLQPTQQRFKHPDASARTTSVFFELLERQFPITSRSERFELRSPKAIAGKLAVHVNYLNRAIKKATGRTTTDHLAEKLIGEAKALLRHTDWNISEISYALGFEDQAQFNNFFKKHTQQNPTSFRQVSNSQ